MKLARLKRKLDKLRAKKANYDAAIDDRARDNNRVPRTWLDERAILAGDIAEIEFKIVQLGG